MIKSLAFLLILCILFGVEATRAFIFGAFGFIFWVAVAIVGFCLLVNIYDELRDKRTPEQKEKDAKEKQERKAAEKAYSKFWHEARKKAWFFWLKFIIITTVTITAITIISMYINNPS